MSGLGAGAASGELRAELLEPGQASAVPGDSADQLKVHIPI